MSFRTNLVRSWLTRSFRPFTFKNEYDQVLPYTDLNELGLYIHLPFCRSLCNFCPYCKVVYRKDTADKYADYLLREIRMVGSEHLNKTGKRKTVTSLYFGGGSPALLSNRIKEIISETEKYFDITQGIGLELHPDDVQEEILHELKNAGITKISIGIQSFQSKYQKILGRKTVEHEILQQALRTVPFETVSMDFIFALPGQTFDDLKSDLELAVETGANHVAIYPFIDFTFTNSPVKAMTKKQKHKLLDDITEYCNSKGWVRNSVWTFSAAKNTGYSSMTRTNFLGFGCSATTLLHDQFKINTFSIEEYEKRIDENKMATSLTIRFTIRQRMIYYLFWMAYGTHVYSKSFEEFFGIKLKKAYGFEFALAKKLGYFTEEDGIYTMTPKGAFYFHYYENFYTLSYIDKMWGLMRTEAFPEKMKL